jgi:Photosynthetic reaction centre cytochrome C subunit
MRTLLLTASLSLVLAQLTFGRASAQIPERFTNLQVLEKDIARTALVTVMRGFAIELGVRCEHCHVGAGNDLSTFDFASDARPAKATARRMMRMIDRVRREDLQGIGDPARQPKLTCFTCHRGARTPATAPAAGGG